VSRVRVPSPAPDKLVCHESETFYGCKNGLVAQGQSGRLITGWSQVRILPGPLRIEAGENSVQLMSLANRLFSFMPLIDTRCGAQERLIWTGSITGTGNGEEVAVAGVRRG
jgi:hypothetical protein